MVTPELHRAHHRTYDTGFPILSGICNPLIDLMLKHIPNQWFWLTLFSLMTIFGIPEVVTVYLPAFEAASKAASAWGIAAPAVVITL